MKILIVGSPGSGKTTFAKKLQNALSIPLYHLDDHYWNANWEKPRENEWKNIVINLTTKPKWIIEGNHYSTFESRLQQADITIFFDIPTWRCLFRILKRTIIRAMGNKSSLPLNIRSDKNYRYKLSLNWHFIRLGLFFKWNVKPKMLTKLELLHKNLIMVKNTRDAEQILDPYFFKNFEKLLNV